jgi:hypothetical protein
MWHRQPGVAAIAQAWPDGGLALVKWAECSAYYLTLT